KPNCDPTYDLDEQGRKHFKPECLAVRAAPANGASKAKPDCDPNYDLDEQGRKHFKSECFVSPEP
ncbi:MAG TPA: hypothetical protein VGL13_17595, partial [Polyangiaceae bacterium]